MNDKTRKLIENFIEQTNEWLKLTSNPNNNNNQLAGRLSWWHGHFKALIAIAHVYPYAWGESLQQKWSEAIKGSLKFMKENNYLSKLQLQEAIYSLLHVIKLQEQEELNTKDLHQTVIDFDALLTSHNVSPIPELIGFILDTKEGAKATKSATELYAQLHEKISNRPSHNVMRLKFGEAFYKFAIYRCANRWKSCLQNPKGQLAENDIKALGSSVKLLTACGYPDAAWVLLDYIIQALQEDNLKKKRVLPLEEASLMVLLEHYQRIDANMNHLKRCYDHETGKRDNMIIDKSPLWWEDLPAQLQKMRQTVIDNGCTVEHLTRFNLEFREFMKAIWINLIDTLAKPLERGYAYQLRLSGSFAQKEGNLYSDVEPIFISAIEANKKLTILKVREVQQSDNDVEHYGAALWYLFRLCIDALGEGLEGLHVDKDGGLLFETDIDEYFKNEGPSIAEFLSLYQSEVLCEHNSKYLDTYLKQAQEKWMSKQKTWLVEQIINENTTVYQNSLVNISSGLPLQFNLKVEFISPLRYAMTALGLLYDALGESTQATIANLIQQQQFDLLFLTGCQKAWIFLLSLRTRVHAQHKNSYDDITLSKSQKGHLLSDEEIKTLTVIRNGLLVPFYNSAIQPLLQKLKGPFYFHNLISQALKDDNTLLLDYCIKAWFNVLSYLKAKPKDALPFYKFLDQSSYRNILEANLKHFGQIQCKPSQLQYHQQLYQFLMLIPDEHGERAKIRLGYEAWKKQVDLLTMSSSKTNRPQVFCTLTKKTFTLPDTWLGNPKNNNASRNAPFDDKGALQRDNSIQGRHVVRRLQNISQGMNIDIYAKAYPEFPGLAIAAGRLMELLFGEGTPISALWIVHPDKASEAYPLWVSETVPGMPLNEYLKQDPQAENIDIKRFQQLAIWSLLVNLEDAKADNFIIDTKKGLITAIDYERAFVPPVSAASAFGKGTLLVKCVLFCFLQMQNTIDSDIKQQILAWDVNKVLKKWLEDINIYDKRYQESFSLERQIQLASNRSKSHNLNQVYMSVGITSQLIATLHRKLSILQFLVREHDSVTLFTLLPILEKPLLNFYEPFLQNKGLSIREKFEKSTNKIYSKPKANSNSVESVPIKTLQSLDIYSNMLPPTKLIVAEKLEPANQYLDLCIKLEKNGTEVLKAICQGKAQNNSLWEQLLNMLKREKDSQHQHLANQLLCRYTRVELESYEPAMQRNIINAWKTLTVSHLMLAGLTELQDTDVESLVRSHQKTVVAVDLSGCNQLTTKSIEALQKLPNLVFLKLDDISNLGQLGESKKPLMFPSLQQLSIKASAKGSHIYLKAPYLVCIFAIDRGQGKVFINDQCYEATNDKIVLKEYKIAIIGNGNAGKTSLIRRYVSNEFNPGETTSAENCYYKKENALQESFCILDTKNDPEEYFFEEYKNNHHGFIFIFSIINQSSLASLPYYKKNILGSFDIPFILVGCKNDLKIHAIKDKLAVADGKSLARDWKCPYIECSANTGNNVNEVFETIVEEINKRRSHGKPLQAPQKRNSQFFSLRLANRSSQEKLYNKPKSEKIITTPQPVNIKRDSNKLSSAELIKQPARDLKIVVMGCGVGKTNLIERYVLNTYVERYEITIESSYRKEITVHGCRYNLEILDTAGFETFTAMRDLYMKNGQGFVLAFSIMSQPTFNELYERGYEEICRVKDSDNVPMVLVGCQSDLSKERVVSIDDALELAKKLDCPYIECSAKNNVNVDKVFEILIGEINRKSFVPEKPRRKSISLSSSSNLSYEIIGYSVYIVCAGIKELMPFLANAYLDNIHGQNLEKNIYYKDITILSQNYHLKIIIISDGYFQNFPEKFDNKNGIAFIDDPNLACFGHIELFRVFRDLKAHYIRHTNTGMGFSERPKVFVHLSPQIDEAAASVSYQYATSWDCEYVECNQIEDINNAFIELIHQMNKTYHPELAAKYETKKAPKLPSKEKVLNLLSGPLFFQKAPKGPPKEMLFKENLVIFGSGGVGKTVLIERYITGWRFNELERDTKIDERHFKRTNILGKQLMLEILDTIGLESYTALRHSAIKNGTGFVLAFSIIAQSTFNDLADIREQIFQFKDREDVPIVLVGCKSDLSDQRVISISQAEELANKWKCPYVECSAKTGENVDMVFEMLLELILSPKKTEPFSNDHCQSPPRLEESILSNNLHNFFTSIPQRPLTKSYKNQHFQLEKVKGDGDCGFTALGLKRQQAYDLLNQNIQSTQSYLSKLLEEELLSGGDFIKYAKEKGTAPKGLETAFQSYQQVFKSKQNIETAQVNLFKYAKDLSLINTYLTYDVQDKKTGGWAHPLALHALAKIQNRKLYLWQPSEAKDYIAPHGQHFEDISNTQNQELHILYNGRDHFDKLIMVPTTVEAAIEQKDMPNLNRNQE